MSSRQIYQTRISQIIDHTVNIRELIIQCQNPNQFLFKAGQFVMLHVPQNPKPVLRAYSIASDDRLTDGFRLIFNFVPGGVASTYVWTLQEGDLLQFTGPFGRLLFHEPPPGQVLFLNTGSGIAQHLSYLLSKAEFYENVKFHLLFGVRSEKDIYYQAPLDQLMKKLKNFKYEFVLSRPSDSWTGKRGYVQHCLQEFDYKKNLTHFYLCGNRGMINEAKHILIDTDGIDPHQVLAEAFD